MTTGTLHAGSVDAVVIVASAGGVEALCTLLSALPKSFVPPVFVVLHLPHNATSYMPQILQRAGNLRAIHPPSDAVIQKSGSSSGSEFGDEELNETGESGNSGGMSGSGGSRSGSSGSGGSR